MHLRAVVEIKTRKLFAEHGLMVEVNLSKVFSETTLSRRESVRGVVELEIAVYHHHCRANWMGHRFGLRRQRGGSSENLLH